MLVKDEQEKFLLEHRHVLRGRIKRRLEKFSDDDAKYFIEQWEKEVDASGDAECETSQTF